jgi:excisionase family DNA binding protein
MTVQEVATSLRESKDSVYRKIRRGDLPAVRLGDPNGPLRVRADELGDYLESLSPEEVGASRLNFFGLSNLRERRFRGAG